VTIQRLGAFLLSLAVFSLLSFPANAAKPLRLPAGEPIGLFDAANSGQIEAKFIPENAAKGTLVVTNKSAKPLTIQLPEAFAGIPVQAQFNVGNNNGPQTANSSPGGTQQLGVTPNNNNRNNQAGPGLFSIAPEQVTKLKVTSVCLEFGKKTPHSRIPYEIAPLSAATASDPRLAGLLNRLRTGHIDQPTAQAAAWHLANNLSWQDLSQKTRRHLGATPEPLFTQTQITRAQQTVTQLTSTPTSTPPPAAEN
jgi:hypothetical protein